MELVIASSNLHKIREFRDIFKAIPHLDILSLRNFPDYTPPEETGETFEENARIKAEHAAKALNKWVLADDSGLVVPALNGAPGIHSRRFSGPNATDNENRKKLLIDLHNKKGLERYAYYECCLVLANADKIKKIVHGICEGTILEKEKGNNGFGYDPLFQRHDCDKSFGEMDETTKNRISHRMKAIEKLLAMLETL